MATKTAPTNNVPSGTIANRLRLWRETRADGSVPSGLGRGAD